MPLRLRRKSRAEVPGQSCRARPGPETVKTGQLRTCPIGRLAVSSVGGAETILWHSIGDTMNEALVRLCVGVCGLIYAGFAQAQSFPHHTVKIIVPTAPGGAIDTTARIIGEKMQAHLHLP